MPCAAIGQRPVGRRGLGEWNVRELVAHTVRAFRTVDQYLDGTVRDPTPLAVGCGVLPHGAGRGRPSPSHRGAGSARGPRPRRRPGRSRRGSGRPGRPPRRAGHQPDTPVHTFVGVIALPDYLATRVVELVVHTLDLAARARPRPPGTAASRSDRDPGAGRPRGRRRHGRCAARPDRHAATCWSGSNVPARDRPRLGRARSPTSG